MVFFGSSSSGFVVLGQVSSLPSVANSSGESPFSISDSSLLSLFSFMEPRDLNGGFLMDDEGVRGWSSSQEITMGLR